MDGILVGAAALFVSGAVAGMVAWDIRLRWAEAAERAAAKATLVETTEKLVKAHNAFVEAQKALGDRLQSHDLQLKSLLVPASQGRKF